MDQKRIEENEEEKEVIFVFTTIFFFNRVEFIILPQAGDQIKKSLTTPD